MSKPEITVTTLTATATDESTFTATRGPLTNTGKIGWSVHGPAAGSPWPSVLGIDQTQATVLLSDCVEAFNRWHAATQAANEALEERTEAIRDYFRSAKS